MADVRRAVVEPQRQLRDARPGRFYTLLILLFGIGFGIQFMRAEGLATDLRSTYYRRTATLLAIDVVHGTLIWRGDILTIYSLVAFALVMFRTASTLS